MTFSMFQSSANPCIGVMIKANALKLPLDVTDDELILLPLFPKSLNLDFQLLKKIDGINIRIFLQLPILLLQPLEYTIILLHLRSKLLIHFDYNRILPLHLFFHPRYLLIKMLL